jgi:hypothetical protein
MTVPSGQRRVTAEPGTNPLSEALTTPLNLLFSFDRAIDGA